MAMGRRRGGLIGGLLCALLAITPHSGHASFSPVGRVSLHYRRGIRHRYPYAMVGASSSSSSAPVSFSTRKVTAVPVRPGGAPWKKANAARSLKKPLTAAVAVTTLIAGLVALMASNPQVRRPGFFWLRAFPVYLHYRFTELCMDIRGLSEEERNMVWDRLHVKHADEILAMVKRLKGYYIKICQFSSSRLDVLPSIWIERFSTLQDDVPPKPGDEVIEIIEKSYGKKLDEVFEYFDKDHPLGSASIGQCHLARLKGGKRVVVKVMYPDAEELFWSDMKTLSQFARICQPAYVPMLEEVKRQFMQEFDYQKEASNQETVRSNMAKAGFGKYVTVPQAYPELCTREVLVMDFIPGVKLVSVVQDQMADARKVVLKGRLSKHQEEHALEVLRPRSSLWERLVGSYTKKFAHWLVDHVVKVHGHQILIDGFFNGDPHPGNILLTPDNRLGLIDYGQIKVLSKEQRVAMARLIVALADDKRAEVVDLFTKMGFKSKKMDPWVIHKMATIYFDKDDATVTGGLNLQVFMEALQARDPFLAVPEDYVMAARVGVFMRGMGTFLDYPLSMAKAWRPLAVRCLREAGEA